MVLTVLLECKSGTASANTESNGANKKLVCTCEFDVRSVLHGQISLAAVNHIHVFHEAMNACKNH